MLLLLNAFGCSLLFVGGMMIGQGLITAGFTLFFIGLLAAGFSFALAERAQGLSEDDNS